MTLDDAIEREIYRTEANREMADNFHTDENIYSKEEEAFRNREDYHSQISEWLKELKIHREIHDVLLQLLVDSDLDICCEDLTDNEKEQKICEENCDNKAKGCWVRWAKMKAGEVSADDE